MKDIVFTPGYLYINLDVTADPSVSIKDWSVVTVLHPDGKQTRHLLGRQGFEGRVSTALVAIDWKSLRAKTESGRIYELDGPPGRDEDAHWVFQNALRVCGQTVVRDHLRAIKRLLRAVRIWGDSGAREK